VQLEAQVELSNSLWLLGIIPRSAAERDSEHLKN
jgi:hypothetical protein